MFLEFETMKVKNLQIKEKLTTTYDFRGYFDQIQS